ncbi:MAG: DUF421 domain-containing protein [Firmicutes bacterium]|nr:DUF421 domain-containing protein [Bacillota bacterium]
MLIIFFRSIITFIILLILLRLMGKRQIGEMQPFELAITLVIADLACFPMTETSIPLIYGIIALITLFILHQFISFLDRSSKPFGVLISGKPSIVLNSTGLNYQEIKRQNICISDVQEAIRNKGYANFDELEYGIFETNGKFTALEKEDIVKNNGKKPLPFIIVEEGKINTHNKAVLEISETQINDIIKQYDKTKKLKDIMVLTLDNNGKVYIQGYRSNYQTIQTDFAKGDNW